MKVLPVPKIKLKFLKGAVTASQGRILTIFLWFGKRNVGGKPEPPGNTPAELDLVGELPHSLKTSLLVTCSLCGGLNAAVLVFWFVLNLKLCSVVAKNTGLRSLTVCDRILALPLPSWVIAGKVTHLSEPQFPLL